MKKEQFTQPYLGSEQGYVLVIVRTGAGGKVAVVRKNRPAWQAGRFNFPGGKIEPRESPLEAAVRETKEEIDIALTLDSLRPVAFLKRPDDFALFVFSAECAELKAARALTDEAVLLLTEYEIKTLTPKEGIENLSWLYGLAFDGTPKCAFVEYDA